MKDRVPDRDLYTQYGEIWNDVYDEYAEVLNKSAENAHAVGFLKSYLKNGIALELGVGNGHIALPLAETGASVHGLDNSERMLASLHARKGSGSVTTHFGDMAMFDLGIQYDLIYCVNSTFSLMATAEQQISCFESIVNALRPDGRVVLDLYYPYTADFSPSGVYGDQRTTVLHTDERRVMVRFARHDRNRQLFISQDLLITASGNKLMPLKMRYVYPTELDLLARISGLELIERYEDWLRRPFENASRQYMSVFRKATN